MYCANRVSRFLRPVQFNLLILVVCASRCICAPALNSAEIRSLIDPIEGTNQDDLLEAVDPVYVRSLFFFPNKCKPGTQLTPDGKCVVPVVRESTVSNSQTALQLAIQYAKRYQAQPPGVRRPKPHRKTPKPELGTETVPTDPTTTATTPTFFSETDSTTLSTLPFNSSESETTTRTRVRLPTSPPYFVEVAVATQSTLGDPPEDVTTSASLPLQHAGQYGESTPGPLLDTVTTLPEIISPEEGTTEVPPAWLQGAEVLISELTATENQNQSTVSHALKVDPTISGSETTIATEEMSTEAPTKPSITSNDTLAAVNAENSSVMRQGSNMALISSNEETSQLITDTPQTSHGTATATFGTSAEIAAEPAKLESSSVEKVMEFAADEQTLSTTSGPAVTESDTSNPADHFNQGADDDVLEVSHHGSNSPDPVVLPGTVGPDSTPISEQPFLQEPTNFSNSDFQSQSDVPKELVPAEETVLNSSETTEAYPQAGALLQHINLTPAAGPPSPATLPIYKATMAPADISSPEQVSSFHQESTSSNLSLDPIVSNNKVAQVSQFLESDRPSKIRFTDQVKAESTPSSIFPTEEAALSNGFRQRLVQSLEQYPMNLPVISAIATADDRSTSIIFPQESSEESRPLRPTEGSQNFHLDPSGEPNQVMQQQRPAKIFDTPNPAHRSQGQSASRQEPGPFDSFELSSTSRELDASPNSNPASTNPFSLLPYLFNYPHYAFPYFSSTSGESKIEHRSRSNLPHST